MNGSMFISVLYIFLFTEIRCTAGGSQLSSILAINFHLWHLVYPPCWNTLLSLRWIFRK